MKSSDDQNISCFHALAENVHSDEGYWGFTQTGVKFGSFWVFKLLFYLFLGRSPSELEYSHVLLWDDLNKRGIYCLIFQIKRLQPFHRM